MTQKTEPTCESCGSNDIVADANAVWNIETQQWELANTFDATYCNSCGETNKGREWKDIPDAG